MRKKPKYFKSWETWKRYLIESNDIRLQACVHPHEYFKGVYGWCATCRTLAVEAEADGEIKL